MRCSSAVKTYDVVNVQVSICVNDLKLLRSVLCSQILKDIWYLVQENQFGIILAVKLSHFHSVYVPAFGDASVLKPVSTCEARNAQFSSKGPFILITFNVTQFHRISH